MPLSQTDIQNQKADARKSLLQKRRALPPEYSKAASDEICRRLFELIKERSYTAVLLYFPVKGETNILPLASLLWSSKITTAFPVSHKDGVMLEFRITESESDFCAGEYSIPEPKDSCPALEDFSNVLCVIPALSADRQGVRLGYGMGYYDRFLAAHGPLTICPIFDKMLSSELPHEPTDVPLDIILTEKEVIFTRG